MRQIKQLNILAATLLVMVVSAKIGHPAFAQSANQFHPLDLAKTRRGLADCSVAVVGKMERFGPLGRIPEVTNDKDGVNLLWWRVMISEIIRGATKISGRYIDLIWVERDAESQENGIAISTVVQVPKKFIKGDEALWLITTELQQVGTTVPVAFKSVQAHTVDPLMLHVLRELDAEDKSRSPR